MFKLASRSGGYHRSHRPKTAPTAARQRTGVHQHTANQPRHHLSCRAAEEGLEQHWQALDWRGGYGSGYMRVCKKVWNDTYGEADLGLDLYWNYPLDTMQEEQPKDLLADAALEGLDEELSVEELEGIAGGEDRPAERKRNGKPKPGWDGYKYINR